MSTGQPAQPPEPTPEKPRSLFRHPDFAKLWTAATVSLLGTQVSLVAIPVIAVLILKASPFEVALLGTVEFLPFLLFTLPAGVWVDRLPRRRILISGDVGRAAMLASIPVAYAAGWLTIWQLFVVAFVNGTLTVFFDIADQSYLPTVVDRTQLVDGNAKLQASGSAAQVVGQPLGGGLVGLLTAPFAVALDALSYLTSAALILAIRRPEAPAERAGDSSAAAASPSSLRREVAAGLRFVLRQPLLRRIAATTGSSNLFGNIATSIFPVFVYRDLALTPEVVGLIGGAFGVGALVGATTASRFADRVRIGPAIVWSAAVGGPALLLWPLSTHDTAPVLMCASGVLGGWSQVVYNVNQVSLRQAITPERMLGRMNATMRFLVWGTIPIGQIVGGAIATLFGTVTAIWVGAIGGLFAFLPVLFSPVRSLQAIPEPEPDEPGHMSAAAA